MTNLNTRPHYRWHPSGLTQHDIARLMSYDLGSALKYAWRAGRKGEAGEDLDKCAWHIRAHLQWSLAPNTYCHLPQIGLAAFAELGRQIARLMAHRDAMPTWTDLICHLIRAQVLGAGRAHLDMALQLVEKLRAELEVVS